MLAGYPRADMKILNLYDLFVSFQAKYCLNLNLKIQHVYAHVCRVRYGDRSRSEMYRHWKHRPFPIILSVHLFVIEVLLLNMKMLCSYPLAVKLWTYTQLKTKMYVYLHAMPFLSNVTSLWVNSGFMLLYEHAMGVQQDDCESRTETSGFIWILQRVPFQTAMHVQKRVACTHTYICHCVTEI